MGNNVLTRIHFMNPDDDTMWLLVDGVMNVEEFAMDQGQPEHLKGLVAGYVKGTFQARIKQTETAEIAGISGTVNVRHGSLLRN